jgi:DNA uptake protein ComE-like DNA-binding protein
MENKQQQYHSGAMRSADIDTAFFDLNTAKDEDIRAIQDLPADLAKAICDRRPFKSMEDVRSVPGMTDDMMDVLLRAGATIGDAKFA